MWKKLTATSWSWDPSSTCTLYNSFSGCRIEAMCTLISDFIISSVFNPVRWVDTIWDIRRFACHFWKETYTNNQNCLILIKLNNMNIKWQILALINIKMALKWAHLYMPEIPVRLPFSPPYVFVPLWKIILLS